MTEYAALGSTHVQVMPAGPDPVSLVCELTSRVLPRLTEIG